jgi:hypothetical protein
MATATLPLAGGGTEVFHTRDPVAFDTSHEGGFSRVAFSAVHVVTDPLADCDPWFDTVINWDATMAFRRHIWSLGLGVAEAMDTAQRGIGLDWALSLELIQRSVAAAREFEVSTGRPALLASGAGTDHLAPGPDVSIDDVIAAYETQCEAVEAAGGRIILMASRALAAAASSPDDYIRVYDRILSQVQEPVIIHWLGEMFDPAMAGYWGSQDHASAMDACLDVIASNADRVDGVKISLLDAQKEITMRRRLPKGVRMYTGDDFNYPDLIAGDAEGNSDALLGIFDAIAPAASAALGALARQDMKAYRDFLEPTVPLSHHIFQTPTRFYKTGIVFLAWLNRHQRHFQLAGGQESARSTLHFAELFRLADKAGLLADPDMAARRMGWLMAVRGVGV